MKRCPTCQRVYNDETVKFCRVDGTLLVSDSIVAKDSPTLILSGSQQGTETTSQLQGSTPSIAVLPFVNMSTDPENEYFCDGLAEELLNALTKIQDLRVAARTSAFSFKGKELDVREIGNKLNVTTVLEGSVRKAAKRLRVTAQLINVRDGYHVWSERYDREMEDVFAIQDEITLAIVDALRVKLLGKQKAEVLKRYTESAEAYEIYLKGRYHLNKFLTQTLDVSELKLAEDLFKEAIEVDSNFALAHSSLGSCHLHYLFRGFGGVEYYTKARKALDRALGIDPNLVEPRVKLTYIDLFEGRSEIARQEIARLMTSAPNELSVYVVAGYVYRLSGLYGRAFEVWDQLLKISPTDMVYASYNRARLYMYQRDYAKARAEIAKGLAYESLHPELHIFGAQIEYYRGEIEKAAASLEDVLRKNPVLHWPKLFLAFCYIARGEGVRALDLVDDPLIAIAEADQDAAYWLASVYALSRDADKALHWLKYAVSIGNENYPWFIADPNWEALRTDARYKAIIGDLQTKWENLSTSDTSSRRIAL